MKLWENEGIAVILIFLINLIAIVAGGVLGLIIRILGEPYAILIMTYYYLKKIASGKGTQ